MYHRTASGLATSVDLRSTCMELYHADDCSMLLDHARKVAKQVMVVGSREMSAEVMDDKPMGTSGSRSNKKTVVEWKA